MKEIEELFKPYIDEKYAEFQSKLTPNLDSSVFIGIRMPDCNKIAKDIKNSELEKAFLNDLPHKYYDENMLHSVILKRITNYEKAIAEVEKFLPYVDNWATCDTMHPAGFKKDKKDLLKHIKKWLKSKHTYTVRFAIDCLMNYYLDEDFSPVYLNMVCDIHSDEYYINMMIAWYFATALAKQYDETINIIELKKLPKWVHNKTIQKAKESFRITDETKQYLNSLRYN